MGLDPQHALSLTTRLVAVGVALASAETLSRAADYGRQGLFAPDVVTILRSGSRPRPPEYLRQPLLLTQFLAAVTLSALGPFSPLGKVALGVTVLGFTFMRWRRVIGGDGAEQMAMLVLCAVLLTTLPGSSPHLKLVATVFIAAQTCLSYATAGVAKLLSPLWREGKALPLILSTSTHGHPGLAYFLRQWRGLAWLAGWLVIAFECLFPLLVVGPSWCLGVACLLGVTFHVGCAVFMGLNSFLWSFPPSYFCVWAVSRYW